MSITIAWLEYWKTEIMKAHDKILAIDLENQRLAEQIKDATNKIKSNYFARGDLSNFISEITHTLAELKDKAIEVKHE